MINLELAGLLHQMVLNDTITRYRKAHLLYILIVIVYIFQNFIESA